MRLGFDNRSFRLVAPRNSAEPCYSDGESGSHRCSRDHRHQEVRVSNFLALNDHCWQSEAEPRTSGLAHRQVVPGDRSSAEGSRDTELERTLGVVAGEVEVDEAAAHSKEAADNCIVAAHPDLPGLRAAHARHTALVVAGHFDLADHPGRPQEHVRWVRRAQMPAQKLLATRPGGTGTAD